MELKDKFLYCGWKNCIFIGNDTYSLVATTDIGPRIIFFGFRDDINMFLEMDSDMGKTGGERWRLYGGTRLWHAPEEIYRTYCPDNFPVKYQWNKKELSLLQETEKTTGLQKEIKIITGSGEDNMVEIIYRIYNRSLWPVRFAPWALSVMRQKGTAIIPQEPYLAHSESLSPARPVVLWAYTDMTDKRWKWGRKYIQLSQDPGSKSPQKAGMLNKQGWAAYYSEKNLFIKKFKFEDGAEYPDYLSNLEVYTDPDIIEIESLGPLETVKPGSFAEHKENWFLFKAELGRSEESIDTGIVPLLKKTII
jgi:hypothetical protein